MIDPSDHDPAAILVDFTRVLLDGDGVDDVLTRLADYCTRHFPVHGIGVLLVDEQSGRLEALTANTDQGRIVEELETAYEEGPCTDAARRRELVHVPDLEAAVARYPRFAPPALEAGVRAIHGIPMWAAGRVSGVLNMIAVEPVSLSAQQAATAKLLADVALLYVVNSRHVAQATAEAAQLRRALDSRILIEQAKGRLAERHRESIAEAFERLRAHARRNRLPLRGVAEAVLADELDL